jgi:hypothetical protein
VLPIDLDDNEEDYEDANVSGGGDPGDPDDLALDDDDVANAVEQMLLETSRSNHVGEQLAIVDTNIADAVAPSPLIPETIV